MVIAELHRGETPHQVVIEVVRRLERGQVLILPTDTVYGLHVQAQDAAAVERIRTIKLIKEHRPFNVIYSTVTDVNRWVKLPDGGNRLQVINSWPGAVTWVLPAKPIVPKHLLGDDQTLGIRIPSHPLLRTICTALDDLIVSTSANRHGNKPAIRKEELDPYLLEEVDGVVYEIEPLSGGPSEVKRWTPAGPQIIRPRLQEVTPETARVNILVVCSSNQCRSPMAASLLAQKLKEKAEGKFILRSAGTIAKTGQRPTLLSQEVMKDYGIDLSSHRSRPVTLELMEWADVVLAVTTDQLGDLHAMFPDFTEKVYLFTTFPEPDVEGLYGIEDPRGMNKEFYQQTVRDIMFHVDRILPKLLETV